MLSLFQGLTMVAEKHFLLAWPFFLALYLIYDHAGKLSPAN
jgi:hypothetical protein